LLVLGLGLSACTPTTSTAIAAQGLERQADGWRGLPLDRPRTMPDVTFTDTDGEPFDLATETAGTPTLLFFGYASCPDICPIHLRTLADAMSKANVSRSRSRSSSCPSTPTGTPRNGSRVPPRPAGVELRRPPRRHRHRRGGAAALDLPGPVVEGPDPRGEGDLIGHPAQVIGFDADGEALRVWPFGARRSDWVADLPRIVEEWSAPEAQP
jgi:protein SCO1